METGGSPGPISSAGCQWCSRSFQVNMKTNNDAIRFLLFSKEPSDSFSLSVFHPWCIQFEMSMLIYPFGSDKQPIMHSEK